VPGAYTYTRCQFDPRAAWGAWTKGASADHEFHVGPHSMVVGPRQEEFQGFNRDASNGMLYRDTSAESYRAISRHADSAMG
jgi:hypothetical protein